MLNFANSWSTNPSCHRIFFLCLVGRHEECAEEIGRYRDHMSFFSLASNDDMTILNSLLFLLLFLSKSVLLNWALEWDGKDKGRWVGWGERVCVVLDNVDLR